MKDLKPFTKLQECPKCLSKYTEKKFFYTSEGEPEYINVKCRGCGYSWDMETADVGKKKEIMEVKEKVDK